MTSADCESRARSLADGVRAVPGLTADVWSDQSEIGGGSVPAQSLPTKVVAVRHAKLTLEQIDEKLRAGTPCIFARVQRERVLFDVRTLLDGDAEAIVAALRKML